MGLCCRCCSIQVNSEALHDDEIPVQKRTCTDVEYFNILVIFLTFVGLSVGVAFLRGDPRRLVHGYDDYGNLCGVQNDPIRGVNGSGMDYSSEKFLLINQTCSNGSCATKRTCVSDCKNGYGKSIIPACWISKTDRWRNNVKSDFPLFERISLDIIQCWRDIIILLIVSGCFSGVPIISLRYFAKTAIFSVLIFVAVASICGTIYCWIRWSQEQRSLNEFDHLHGSLNVRQAKAFLVTAALLTLFTILYSAVLYCLKGKMKMIIMLFEEAAKSIVDMPSLFLLPVLTHALLVVLCISLIGGLVAVQTSGDPTVDFEGKVAFPVSGYFGFIRGLLYFGFVWLSQFFLACQSLIISGSIARWYFTRNKTNLRFSVWRSVIMVVKYHLGTAAFASVILFIAKPIRTLCRILEKSSNNKNWVIKILWSSIQCFLVCFEYIFKYLNKNAYAMTVLYSEDFCTSSRRAVECIAANTTKVAVVDGLGAFVLMTIELCVSVGVTVIAITVFQNVEGLQGIWVPSTLIFIFSYLCCHSFTSIYEMTIETLFVCFCEDCRTNDGLIRPYFMSKSFAAFMQSSRRSSMEMRSTTDVTIISPN